MKYSKLFQLEGSGFHLVRSRAAQNEEFLRRLQEELPDGAYVAVVEGGAIQNKQGLFKSFAKALRFPAYFGHNWDALEECIRDLGWIRARSYVLVMKDTEKMKLTEDEFSMLVDILKKAAREWMVGNTHNPSFPAEPTPFHIVFAVAEDKADVILASLRLSGVEGVDVVGT